ncbi:MAG: efflux RND transporter periplasmic adaptor subunit, partial [Gammaproteobacteria bacterium]|nr:efflux RND transporter periplasmic adaptor subunit [Gammaproteobacteria bacterium]
AIFGFFKLRHKTNTPKTTAVPVTVQTVQEQMRPDVVETLGTLSALNKTSLRPEVDGYIKSIQFDSGQYVHQGDLLIQLDDVKARQEAVSAEATYRVANLKYQRALKLLKKHYVAQQDVDLLQGDLQAKESAMRTAKDDLMKRSIRAPFDGYLGEKIIHAGDFVKAGQTLVDLIDRHLLVVDYSLPENDLGKIKLGQKVSLKSTVFPDRVFVGVVSYIAPSVDPDTHTVVLQAKVKNVDNVLSPGIYVNVRQVLSSERKMLVVPEQSIVKRLDSTIVYRVVRGKAEAVSVTTGALHEGFVSVRSALKKGDVIVVSGQDNLQDGARVQTVSS